MFRSPESSDLPCLTSVTRQPSSGTPYADDFADIDITNLPEEQLDSEQAHAAILRKVASMRYLLGCTSTSRVSIQTPLSSPLVSELASLCREIRQFKLEQKAEYEKVARMKEQRQYERAKNTMLEVDLCEQNEQLKEVEAQHAKVEEEYSQLNCQAYAEYAEIADGQLQSVRAKLDGAQKDRAALRAGIKQMQAEAAKLFETFNRKAEDNRMMEGLCEKLKVICTQATHLECIGIPSKHTGI